MGAHNLVSIRLDLLPYPFSPAPERQVPRGMRNNLHISLARVITDLRTILMSVCEYSNSEADLQITVPIVNRHYKAGKAHFPLDEAKAEHTPSLGFRV